MLVLRISLWIMIVLLIWEGKNSLVKLLRKWNGYVECIMSGELHVMLLELIWSNVILRKSLLFQWKVSSLVSRGLSLKYVNWMEVIFQQNIISNSCVFVIPSWKYRAHMEATGWQGFHWSAIYIRQCYETTCLFWNWDQSQEGWYN